MRLQRLAHFSFAAMWLCCEQHAQTQTTPEPAILVPNVLFSVQDGTGQFTNLEAAWDVAGSGNLLAVAALVDGAVTLMDITNPSAPIMQTQIKDGTGAFTSLDGARGVALTGNLLAVAAQFDHAVTLIDVRNPAAPVRLAELRDGAAGFDELDNVVHVAVSGHLLAIAAYGDDAVTLVDISEPANPVLRAVLKDGPGGYNDLNGAFHIAMSGNLLAIAANDDNAVTLVDVSDPIHPVLRAVLRDGVAGFDELAGACGVALSGGLLAIAAQFDDAVTLVDVSDPSNPTLEAILKDGVGGWNELNGAWRVTLSGTVLAVSAHAENSLTLIDVTNPVRPVMRGVFRQGERGVSQMTGPVAMAFAGEILAVTARDSSGLMLIEAVPVNPSIGFALAQSRAPTRYHYGAEFIDPGLSLVESSPISWEGALFEVRLETGLDQECTSDACEQIIIDGKSLPVRQDGNRVLFDGTPIGAVEVFPFATESLLLRVRFDANASRQAVEATMRSLLYWNPVRDQTMAGLSGERPTRRLRMILTDSRGRRESTGRAVDFARLDGFEFVPWIWNYGRGGGPMWEEFPVPLSLQFSDGMRHSFYWIRPLPDLAFECDCSPEWFQVRNDLIEGPQALYVDINSSCSLIARAGSLTARAVLRLHSSSPSGACPVRASSPPVEVEPSAPAPQSVPGSNVAPSISIPVFYAFEALIRDTSEGARLAGLYRVHGSEIVRIFIEHADKRDQAAQVLRELQPGLAALFAGTGSDFRMSQGLLDRVKALGDAFVAHGGPKLKAAVEQERERFNNFQDFAGKSLTQVAHMLVIPSPTEPWIHLSNPRVALGRFRVEANAITGFEYSLWKAFLLPTPVWEPVTKAVVRSDGYSVELTDPTPSTATQFYSVRARPVTANR
ncbi:MAG: hypothetical protein L0Z50_15155 [Verrucomicrobiales bacterium]|nr:hypothetical protein [Verrucomicrobiales bacterium]